MNKLTDEQITKQIEFIDHEIKADLQNDLEINGLLEVTAADYMALLLEIKQLRAEKKRQDQ